MAAQAIAPTTKQPVLVTGTPPPASPVTMVVIVAAVVAALYFGRDVFIPLALAILLSFALSPIVTRLRRLGLGRAPSVLITVLVALAFVGGFAWLLVNQAMSLAQDLPKYEYNLRQKMRLLHDETAGSGVLEQTADLLRRMGQEIEDTRTTGGTKGPATSSTGEAGTPKTVQPIPVELHTPPEGPLQAIREVLGIVAQPLATAGIMLLFVIFVLIQREDLRDRFIRLFGSRDVHRTTEAMSDAGSRIGRYLLMQLVINCTFGLLFGIGLYVTGVPNPALWGLVGVVLRFVPYVGAPIAMLFPLMVALAADAGWTMPILVFALFLGIEAVCAYVMEPLLYGSSTGLSPAALIIAASFWTVLWGPVGLLLATPLSACLLVVGRHVPQLEFLEILFGNKAVLTPATRFYQRLLADDPREAEEVAEQHERQHGLASTFEEVVLPAIGLVEADRQRGAFDRERQREIAQDMIEIAEDVAGETAPPRNEAAPVLCLGARSGLDEAGALLLASLLREQGYDAALVDAAELGSPQPAALPQAGIRLVCLSRVNTAGLAQARRLTRRLKARFGAEVPILIGLWNADADRIEPETLATHLGVSRVALDLGTALAAVREMIGPPPPAAATVTVKAASAPELAALPAALSVPALG